MRSTAENKYGGGLHDMIWWIGERGQSPEETYVSAIGDQWEDKCCRKVLENMNHSWQLGKDQARILDFIDLASLLPVDPGNRLRNWPESARNFECTP